MSSRILIIKGIIMKYAIQPASTECKTQQNANFTQDGGFPREHRKGTYKTLKAAIAAAKEGDIILRYVTGYGWYFIHNPSAGTHIRIPGVKRPWIRHRPLVGDKVWK